MTRIISVGQLRAALADIPDGRLLEVHVQEIQPDGTRDGGTWDETIVSVTTRPWIGEHVITVLNVDIHTEE